MRRHSRIFAALVAATASPVAFADRYGVEPPEGATMALAVYLMACGWLFLARSSPLHEWASDYPIVAVAVTVAGGALIKVLGG